VSEGEDGLIGRSILFDMLASDFGVTKFHWPSLSIVFLSISFLLL
jgi:hypothetical protein